MKIIKGNKTTNSIISDLFNEKSWRDFAFMIFGVFMASIGLKAFLLPNGFLDGGAIGLSLLAKILTELDLSILIIIINIPFIILGSKQISWAFAIKGTISILSLSLLVHFIELPIVTHDKLLISIFGGFFLGSGIGFSIRGGSVIDGTEVLAITVSRKSSLTVGDFISIFNVGLFCFAALLVNIETAMYSMLTYFSASKTVDFIVNGIDEYIGVMIISNHSETIKNEIMYTLGRGVTILKSGDSFGKTGLNEKERTVLFCVVTRFEVSKLIMEIDKIDEKSFVIQYPIKDTKGGMIKKRPFH